MVREQTINVALTDVVLPDARTGDPLVLSARPGVWVLTLIRHRY